MSLLCPRSQQLCGSKGIGEEGSGLGSTCPSSHVLAFVSQLRGWSATTAQMTHQSRPAIPQPAPSLMDSVLLRRQQLLWVSSLWPI